jgi:RNase H-like domain found in reverse transcriptase
MKDVDFNFDEHYFEAFCRLKKALMSAPILQPQDWRLPFEIMCDASDYAVRAVLGQRVKKKSRAIYYGSRKKSQVNYTTTEKELLAIVFAINKWCTQIMLQSATC